VGRTGDIGLFKIIYEGSIAAGVRRIEAITGEGALEKFQEATAQLAKAGELLRTSDTSVLEQVEKLLEQRKILERELEQVKTKMAHEQAATAKSRPIKNANIVTKQFEGLDSKQLRVIVDSLRNRWPSAVIVIASVNDSTVSIVSAVSKDITSKVHAGKLVGEVAKAVG